MARVAAFDQFPGRGVQLRLHPAEFGTRQTQVVGAAQHKRAA
jgi:hypothetical protein